MYLFYLLDLFVSEELIILYNQEIWIIHKKNKHLFLVYLFVMKFKWAPPLHTVREQHHSTHTHTPLSKKDRLLINLVLSFVSTYVFTHLYK